MKLTCPSCGAIHSIDAWENDAKARQCLRLVAELPQEVSRRSIAYMAMFRPLGGRGLGWDKALRLLTSLKDEVSAAHIQWKRQVSRPNDPRHWAGAMEKVTQQPPKDLPLTSHGYLKAIAYQLADEADRRSEVYHNKAERTGTLQAQREATTDGAEPIDPDWMRQVRKERLGR
ncbi:MAG: hypothetical protein ABIL58_20055 [Pseudomonadota bacterium]